MTTAPRPAIILVDDEPDVLTILHRLVRDFATGYELVPLADGAAAFAEIVRRPVALLITDHRMPGMDGLTLTAVLKRVAPQCPVLLLSGYPSTDLKQRGRCRMTAHMPRRPIHAGV